MREEKEIEILQGTIKTIDEAARQLSAISPLLQTAYLAIVSLSGLRTIIGGGWLGAIGFLTPILLWVISLFSAVRVFIPQKVSSDISERDEFRLIRDRKLKLMAFSQYSLLAGLLTMAAIIAVYFVYLPSPADKPTTLIVITATPLVGSPTPAMTKSPTITPTLVTPTSAPITTLTIPLSTIQPGPIP